MKHLAPSIAGIVLAAGMAFAQPGIVTAGGDDGDVVDVIMDKQIYGRGEPIVVMAKYTNVGNEFHYFSNGGCDTTVSAYMQVWTAVEGASPARLVFSSKLNVVDPCASSEVAPHSAAVLAYTTIPASVPLTRGLYRVRLTFSAKEGPPVSTSRPTINTVAQTVFQVR